MRILHSRFHATQLWRYVSSSLKHDNGLLRGRPESVIVAGVDDQIATFCTAFANLRKDFDSRLAQSTALLLSQTASSINMKGTHPNNFGHFTLSDALYVALRQVLRPEVMDKYNRMSCLENTRRNVINDVMAWIADDSNKAWIQNHLGVR